MNRRELLKRAAVIPAATLGTLLASSTPAEAAALFGTITNVFPGGFGPESLNGGDIVLIATENGTGNPRVALVGKKTKIFISGQKVKWRRLLEEVYTNQAVLLAQLQGASLIATYKTGLQAKQVDISFPL